MNDNAMSEEETPAVESKEKDTKNNHLRRQKGRDNLQRLAPKSGLFALPDPVPQWYTHNGLRKVKPYLYAFHSWAKERWQGRTLIDVYGEFRGRSTEYYEWAIETGAIVVNNKICTPDTVLQNGDLISNVAHRHEPPVTAAPVKILYDGRLPGNDGQTFVVEKPGSMPVHSTGRYHFNSLLSILKYDYNLPLVHTTNRLDRLTSGVMICALTVEKSRELGDWFGGRRANQGGGVHKEYVARVKGCFPESEIICEEPLLTIDRQLGVNVVHPQGRPSKTIFNRLSYHERSNTSVVHCRPITGRSHQIRVHLQFLGYPIANDPVYQNEDAWGKTGGKGGLFEDNDVDLSFRRQMGDLLLDQAKERNRLEGNPNLINPDPPPLVHYQGETPKSGHQQPQHQQQTVSQRKDNENEEEPGTTSVPLSEQAKKALRVLRECRDESDGWARQRDVDGIQLARQAGATGVSPPAQSSSSTESNHKRETSGDEAEKEEDEQIQRDPDVPALINIGKDGMGFCSTCFTPVLADPKPEQLFIWLHALRYWTTDWDWKSEMPDWALDTWEAP